MINKIAISVKAYHSRTGERRRRWATARRRCAIGRTACWRCLALQFSRPSAERAYRAGAAGGQYVVFKPSELTPHSGEAVVKLWAEAGLPPGC
jgi:succinylglutamic semialdehyde dehydrogenase